MGNICKTTELWRVSKVRRTVFQSGEERFVGGCDMRGASPLSKTDSCMIQRLINPSCVRSIKRICAILQDNTVTGGIPWQSVSETHIEAKEGAPLSESLIQEKAKTVGEIDIWFRPFGITWSEPERRRNSFKIPGFVRRDGHKAARKNLSLSSVPKSSFWMGLGL